jgi:hypothetical protein
MDKITIFLNKMFTRVGKIYQSILQRNNLSHGEFKKRSGNYFGMIMYLTSTYFKEIFARLIGEIVLLSLAVYSRFILLNPPVLPVLPDGTWYKGLVIIGYLSFIIFSYGFAMQRFGKDNTPATAGLFPLWILFVGNSVALYMWVPLYIIIPFSAILLTSLMINGYEEQGRYGVLPLARIPLIFLVIWISALGEFGDLYAIKVALLSIPLQGWISLGIFVIALVIVIWGSYALGQYSLRRKVAASIKNAVQE